MASYLVNDIGMKEIRAFLSKKHKLGEEHFDDRMISAWAKDAEAQLDIGNPPTIELKSWESMTGHVETYTISDNGVEALEARDDQ